MLKSTYSTLLQNTDFNAQNKAESSDKEIETKISSPFEEKFIQEVTKLKGTEQEFPAEFRLEIFKSLLKDNPENPEQTQTKIVRVLFDFDLEFVKHSLQHWELKKDQAQKALSHINDFFANQQLPDKMSFRQHAYYCFCLSALLSGIDPENLNEEYDTQLHTMVLGVIHPKGKWSIKTELEDQSYAKFIFHVSGTGLTTVPLINQATSFRVDKKSAFCGVRLQAIACNEKVGFDGIEDCGSLKVLRHDFIHAGFMKYALQTDSKRYWDCLEKIGLIYEDINEKLEVGSQLRQQVEGALFMWGHELTTSVFVHGFPRHFPKQHLILGGKYASAPQMFLMLGAKLGFIPKIFSKEIDNEAAMLQSLGLNINENNNTISDSQKIKEVMDHLNVGYAYLNEHYEKIYGYQDPVTALVRRTFGNG
jgi:hypothetical protein